MNSVVIDANVFAKLFIAEPDSGQAKAFFRHCIENRIALFAPTLFTYEVLQIALYYQHPLQDAVEKIESYLSFNLTLLELEKHHWLSVEAMVNSGHEKSGYPSLYDSSYHVLAKSMDCYFLTADKRHLAKTQQFGAIKLLGQWKTL